MRLSARGMTWLDAVQASFAQPCRGLHSQAQCRSSDSVTENFIPRQLSFQHDREAIIIAADVALADCRLADRPLILLGEAGSGKSELLRHWSDNRFATARQLLNGWDSGSSRAFVDGLDEAAGLKEGDALDAVLGALEAQQNTNFVLACRVADWQSASAVKTIQGWTSVDPVELTLVPLGESGVIQFLCHRCGFEQAAASGFVEHYEGRGFSAWLGNPQTLTMLAKVAKGGARPDTTRELFDQFVDCVWQEHRKQAGGLANAAKAEVLDALGAVSAAIIIGGYDAITLAPGGSRRDGDLPLSECKSLPGITKLPEDRLEAFLGSRLVAGLGDDRFTYQHRRIGEYLGACWLAAQASTPELRARLLAALRHNGLVPSNLRGLWGWLAVDEAMAADVIGTDPLATIDYGDADTLGPLAAKALLVAIEQAEDRHEAFGWREYRAASLVQAALAPEVERIITEPSERRFWTQFILLRQMRTAEVVTRHKLLIRAVMLDERRDYAIRDAAAEALADYGGLNDWPAIIAHFVDGQVRESLRLALVLMLNPNVGLTLSDAEFAETAFAYSGLTPRFSSSRELGTVALYHLGRRQAIGDERLDGVLDALADCANRYLNEHYNSHAWDVEHLFHALLERRLALGHVTPEALWRWLNAKGYDDYGSSREARERVNVWLQANKEVRRALQHKVLDKALEKPRTLGWRLREIAPGLLPSTDDVVALLNALPEGDERWRELIWLAPCRAEGQAARDAAARHVRIKEDRKTLREHSDPPPAPWEKEEARRKAKLEAEQQARRSGHRADYLAGRERMQRGEWGALVGPAQVYLGRTHELNNDTPPEQRIATWIGEDLQAEAFAGFEVFLTAEPLQPPSAQQIAESYANSRSWNAAIIIVAALAERVRTGRACADVPNERIRAGLLEIVAGLFQGEEWKPLQAALTDELRRRGDWEAYARLLIEPQLKRRAAYPTGLWTILAVQEGAALAAEWLHAFPRLAAEPEEELIDHLLRDGSETSRTSLAAISGRRRRMKTLDDRRRRNWGAVELILGLTPPTRIAKIASENPGFLWVLRNRMSRRRRDGSTTISPSPGLLAMTVAVFAPCYPRTSMPSGTQTGDTNPWDATDFLDGCLDTLAADPSPEAGAALATLEGIDNGYAFRIGRSIADQHRGVANAKWRPHPVDALVELIIDGPPVDHADLQRVLLAELDIVQGKIQSSDTDPCKRFYKSYKTLEPNIEDDCSDVVVDLLRQTDRPLSFAREIHLGDNREGDIWCSSGTLAVAIECKRHWHPDLWTAFDRQLAKQQAVDWRARGYGIYLVYWFGDHVHPVTGPPTASGIAKPMTAEMLEAALRDCVTKAGLPDIAVRVLDVSRATK